MSDDERLMAERRERRREYLICQERGHGASSATLTSNPPWSVCSRCGTHYRAETRVIESNVPIRVLCERDHWKGVECPTKDCPW